MDRKTRERMVPHVEKLLLRPPGRDVLFELLSLCNPDLTARALEEEIHREKAFRALKACLHPDKHLPAHRDRVTKLFQSVQTFYLKACQELLHPKKAAPHHYHHHYHRSSSSSSNSSAFQRPPKRRSSSSSSARRTHSPNSVIQLDFDIFSKWPWLNQVMRETPFQAVTTSELYYSLAYQCLNLRGAIVHGQPIECTYQVPVNLVETPQAHRMSSIQDVWQEAGFPPNACRILKGGNLEDIKHELTHHGPILSTSFQLHETYYRSTRHAGNFSEGHVGQTHPLLIVGWTMKCEGEVWLVQGLRGPTFSIGMGQFQIEEKCLAPPMALLECKSWQSPGPFWDVPYIAAKCDAWKEHFDTNTNTSNSNGNGNGNLLGGGSLVEMAPITSDELEALGDLFNVGFNSFMLERRPFVLRDAEKMAQSRRVILRDVGRVLWNGEKTWKVTLQVLRK